MGDKVRLLANKVIHIVLVPLSTLISNFHSPCFAIHPLGFPNMESKKFPNDAQLPEGVAGPKSLLYTQSIRLR